jgi:hypothetical protein
MLQAWEMPNESEGDMFYRLDNTFCNGLFQSFVDNAEAHVLENYCIWAGLETGMPPERGRIPPLKILVPVPKPEILIPSHFKKGSREWFKNRPLIPASNGHSVFVLLRGEIGEEPAISFGGKSKETYHIRIRISPGTSCIGNIVTFARMHTSHLHRSYHDLQ